ncbi:MAG TPA: GNAT family N-acetyltransferase [Solirubrobacteraceae bacterium]|nr:GNAT family N-acetyltransferase [Solirubrobacteraceae bacterium]
MSPSVRRLRAGEAALLRDVRLAALRDAPMAFGSTLAREEAFAPDVWEKRAAAGAAGIEQVVLVAEPEAGLAMGRLDDDPTAAGLYSMWVAPHARGEGVARALVEAVIAWATERGARTLTTSVAEGNAGAARLYTSTGFADTGRREPLGHSDGVVAVFERPLGDRSVGGLRPNSAAG